MAVIFLHAITSLQVIAKTLMSDLGWNCLCLCRYPKAWRRKIRQKIRAVLQNQKRGSCSHRYKTWADLSSWSSRKKTGGQIFQCLFFLWYCTLYLYLGYLSNFATGFHIKLLFSIACPVWIMTLIRICDIGDEKYFHLWPVTAIWNCFISVLAKSK